MRCKNMIVTLLLTAIAFTFAGSEAEAKKRTHHAFGVTIKKLPSGHRNLIVGNARYYYDVGIFYRAGPSGYVVVPGPLGARVPALPSGYITVHVGPSRYFYYYGTFYTFDPRARSYVVVAAPVGAVVPEIPTGFVSVSIGGRSYYRVGGVFYLPMTRGSEEVYEVTQPPEQEIEAGEPQEKSGTQATGRYTSVDYGVLAVRAQPQDVQILVDGEAWPATEGEEELIVHLPAGLHRVELRKEGYQSFATEVDIQTGRSTPLNVKLAELPQDVQRWTFADRGCGAIENAIPRYFLHS